MKLVRTFHPVGHGAFYTERFYDEHNQNVANIVFDCGCHEACKPGKSIADFQKQIDDIVDCEFPLNEVEKITIDALFISHFHIDHMNGISRLLNNCNVKRIIMPKLTDDVLLDVFLYTMFVHEFSAKDAYDAIDGFIKYVEELKVEVEINEDDINDDAEFEETDFDTIGILISKPTIIKVHSLWKYIPFSTKEKKAQLKQALINGVPELSAALSVSPIDLKQIADEFTNKPDLVGKCRKVYDSCFGNNNQHNRYSMTLFSGTCDKQTTCTQQCHQSVVDLPRYCTKNCLYMGDFEADPTKSLKNTNCEQLLKFYERYWSKIGMFQVPHHGSRDNTNVKLYSPPKFGIISAGTADVYLNPHIDVINLLQQYNCVPLIVTEDPTTVQKFYYKIR